MNPAEAEVYRRLTNIPHREKIAAESKKVMHRLAEERFKQERKARAERRSRMGPVHEALRAAAKASPELADVRAAISAVSKHRPERLQLPHPAPLPAPKSPVLKLGSVNIVDVPPFQGLTSANLEGFGEFAGPTADGTTGNMNFFMFSGADSSGAGAGFMNCWTAIGQLLSPPEGQGNNLMFLASPSFSWNAIWISNWWRQAAGNVWIGQVINRFDSNGVFIDTPVVTQNQLFAFDDYNFSDMGFQPGFSSGDNLSCSLFVESNLLYECWVWAGGSANSDWSNGQSLANVGLSASLSSLTLNID